MRQIAISVLSLFVVLPAFANVRLPVVNVAAGGISAREAFGEPIIKQSEAKAPTAIAKSNTNTENKEKSVASNEKESRAVVSRAATTQKASVAKPVDSGEQIVASDVLSPRRPSADLWARASSSSDVIPLRLPSPDEFSVIRSDTMLPEESLDGEVVASQRTSDVSRNASSVSKSTDTAMSELDAQIAHLNELQRRADESVKSFAAENNLSQRKVVSRSSARNTNIANESVAKAGENDDVRLSRVVVPFDDVSDDVVVRAVQRAESPRIVETRNEMAQMSPSELRKAFRKTFLSENKHLSTFQIDDRFDVASDMTANAEGFTSQRDLSETAGTQLGGIRPLEIKIKFRNADAALSRDNYNLLTEYAGIVLSNPTRAVQVSIPQNVTTNAEERKLAARRLAIIEQVLRDNGISEQRILPVLSQRDEEGLVLRMISLDQYETLTKQQKDIFGDTVSKKTYRSMSW